MAQTKTSFRNYRLALHLPCNYILYYSLYIMKLVNKSINKDGSVRPTPFLQLIW
jgi:hypothetical protein